MSQPINESVSQPTNQSISQPINQSIEQPDLPNVLLGMTGSVATIKAIELVTNLQKFSNVRLIVSNRAQHFCDISQLRSLCTVYTDDDEWNESNRWKRGDAVLHIELRKWASVFVIAPLSANSLSLIATGGCPSLLLCVARAWDFSSRKLKPLVLAPAMNVAMYEHPITSVHLLAIARFGSNVHIISPIEKILACGDKGIGAMEEPAEIARQVQSLLPKSI